MKVLFKCLLSGLVGLTLTACGGGAASTTGTTPPIAPPAGPLALPNSNRLTDQFARQSGNIQFHTVVDAAQFAAAATPLKGGATTSGGLASDGTALPRVFVPHGVTQSGIETGTASTMRTAIGIISFSGNGAQRIGIEAWQAATDTSTLWEVGSITTAPIPLPLNETAQYTLGGATWWRHQLTIANMSGGVATAVLLNNRLSASDTDYLSMGVWTYHPEIIFGYDNLQFAAFATGAAANLTKPSVLTTAATAIYRGPAVGLHITTDRTNNIANNTARTFDGTAELTATFQASPMLAGSIDLTDSNGDTAAITLSTANIANELGGFFTGDTAATIATKTYAGKYGGQIYGSGGDSADYIGGTFGIAINETNFDDAWLGSFAVDKQ